MLAPIRFVIPICIAFVAIAVEPKSPQVIQTPNATSVELGDSILWTYNHATEEGKPYFHPLSTTNGTVFSDLRPNDHPWHRGLWFSWKKINGLNYWEEDRDTGKPIEGYTRLLHTNRNVSNNKAVQFQQALEYAPTIDASPILLETRVITVTSPDSEGRYTIDWVSTFTAPSEDVILDRTPLPNQEGGKSYGGYAGLSLRMAKTSKPGSFTNESNLRDGESHRISSPWMTYTVSDDSSVLFMDHPKNITFPSKWYVAPSMPYFSPAIIHDSAYTIPAQKSLTLRYRIVVSNDLFNSETIDEEWDSWTSTLN